MNTIHPIRSKATKGLLVSLAACALVLATASPGVAATPEESPLSPENAAALQAEIASDGAQGDLQLVAQGPDGEWSLMDPLESSPSAQWSLAEQSSGSASSKVAPGGGEVTPQLIDLNQWTQCFTFNNVNLVFGKYTWVKANGTPVYISLKCGNDAFGYRHIIKGGHDKDWQNKLNAARAVGWTSENYKVYSWDDLMALLIANMIAVHGDFYHENYTSNKACTIGNYGLYNTNTHTLSYTFRATVAWSMNNLHVITAFPSSSQVCTA